MIPAPKSATLYAFDILQALSDTGIRQTSPGGKARAFCDIVADKLGDSENYVFQTVTQSLLPYAIGDNLDLLGDIYGVSRIGRSDAKVLASDQNFRFYVQSGTFGSINGGNDIKVPAKTRIYGADGLPVYMTSYDLVLPALANEAYFAAISVETGSSGNAAAGVYNKHSFTSYKDSYFGTLLVTNDAGIVGGRDAEDDESYRYRINLKLKSQNRAGESDLRLAVLSVPGVQDVVFDAKAGTYYCYVYGISPKIGQNLLSMVQQQLDAVTSYPIRGVAIAPQLVGISVSARVRFASSTSAADRSLAISQAQDAAELYINNLQIGQALSINEIADRIRNANSSILDLGDPNAQLDSVFIWRSREDGSRYSRFLVTDYTPSSGERIVVESVPNAINLVIS